MRIHAIQTGSVRIKTAQVERRGRGLRRWLSVMTDRNRTRWLPTDDGSFRSRELLSHLFEGMPMLEPWISRWVRSDAAAVLVIALWAVTATNSSWIWFLALFLVPDLSMIGYVFGPRVGAITYNAGHLYAWPVGLLAAGLAAHASLATTAALSWIAHIAFDNVVGYGLKLPIGFEHTVYGPIGRARAAIERTKSAAG